MYIDRIRTRDLTRYGLIDYVQGPSTHVVYKSTVPNVGHNQVILDHKTTHFKPGRTYRFNDVDMRKSVGSSSFQKVSWKGNYSGIKFAEASGDLLSYKMGFPSITSAALWDSTRANRALQEAYASLSQPDVDMGMMFAEAGETLGLLTKPFNALGKLGSRLWKDFDLTTAQRAIMRSRRAYDTKDTTLPTKVASRWLEYRYGILPTMMDAEGIIDLFHRKVAKREGVVRYTVGTDRTETSATSTNLYQQLALFRFYQLRTLINQSTFTAKCYYRNSFGSRESFGGGLYDIPNLLWERIPYSFVLDWWFNIGQWLRAIQPKPDITYIANCVSQKTYVADRRWLDRATFWPTGQAAKVDIPGEMCVESRMLCRKCNLPIPSLPVCNFDLTSFQHTLDSIGLSYQNASRKFKGLR